MKYLIVIEQTKTGFSAYSPDLPGCIATGATRTEVEENIRGAIRMHLRSMLRDGDAIPQPGTWTTEVEVDLESLRGEAPAARAAG